MNASNFVSSEDVSQSGDHNFSRRMHFDEDIHCNQIGISITPLTENEEAFLYDCTNSNQRKYFWLVFEFWYICVLGIFKLVLGIWTIIDGNRANVIATEGDFQLAGILLTTGGFSSLIFFFWTYRIIIYHNNVKNTTAKQMHSINFVMLYITVFDVIACVLLSKYNHKDFPSDIVNSMNQTLSLDYMVTGSASESDYTKQWDFLQSEERCCGARFYSDWFTSDWAKTIKSSRNLEVVPSSCRLFVSATGACSAIGGQPLNDNSGLLVALSNYTKVSICSLEDQQNGNVDYIHAACCADIYLPQLITSMKISMWVAVCLLIMDLILVLSFYKVAMLLPRRQQIHSYEVEHH